MRPPPDAGLDGDVFQIFLGGAAVDA